MKEVFEKIIEKLEEKKDLVPVNRLLDDIINDKPLELGQLMAYAEAIEIVNQVAEEYNKEYNKKHNKEYNTDVPDINVGSNDAWNPCSVGLPKAHIEVWITYKWDDGSIHVGRDRVIHGEWYCTKREAVIAWKYMKVPVPYQPKGENK